MAKKFDLFSVVFLIGVFQVFLIILKVSQQITWSWLKVLAPLIICESLVVIIGLILILGCVIASCINYLKGKNREPK